MAIAKKKEESQLTAVIYSRVSSTKQKLDGSGLESQEHRCREYAASKGNEVEAVFPDDASGGGDFMKRPGMVALLSYLDAQPAKSYVVIFDDLKRFAREIEMHIQLRQAFKARGALVECLNFKFEDTPEGKFIETIIAAQGELEREQNRRQIMQKMKARVENGFWYFVRLWAKNMSRRAVAAARCLSLTSHSPQLFARRWKASQMGVSARKPKYSASLSDAHTSRRTSLMGVCGQ